MLFLPTHIFIYNLARDGLKMKGFQILRIRKSVIHAVCLCSPLCVSERGKLCHTYRCACSRICVSERGKLLHTYIMFMIQTLCIKKRETVSYLQYDYDLDFLHQKEGNSVIPTICLCSRFFASERGELYHTYNMFMLYIQCIRKRETVSYLQYVYVLDFLHHKEGNCVIPTVCLCCRF